MDYVIKIALMSNNYLFSRYSICFVGGGANFLRLLDHRLDHKKIYLTMILHHGNI